MNPELKEKMFVDYIHEFAWRVSLLYNTTLTHEQKMEIIGETFKTPEEFVSEFLHIDTKNTKL